MKILPITVSMIPPVDSPTKPPIITGVGTTINSNSSTSTSTVPLTTWHAYNQISFGYKHPFKDIFKKGELPTVKVGLYGDVLTKKNVSLEHVKPHSLGGKSSLSNYALASADKNNARGNSPLAKFLTKEQAITYLNQFRDVEVTSKSVLDSKGNFFKFNGNNYIKSMITTLAEEHLDVSSSFKDILHSGIEQVSEVAKSSVKKL